jgi:hypothetical protein
MPVRDLDASTVPMLQMWQQYVRPVFALTASVENPAQRKRVVNSVARFAKLDDGAHA